MILELHVNGIPAPQGSKNGRAIYRGKGDQREFTGKVVLHESSKKVAPWRQAVKAAALNTVAEVPGWKPLDEPVEIGIVFWFERPRYHFGTGRNAHLLKAGAPSHVPVYPDLDKLLRSTLDGLGSKTGAGVIRNDSQVVRFTRAEKRYSNGRPPGADITITPLNSVPALTSTPSTGTDPDAAAAPRSLPPGAAAAPNPVAAPLDPVTAGAATVQEVLL